MSSSSSKVPINNLNFIRVIPCFSHLTDAQMEELLGLMNELTIAKGEVITRENDIVDAIYFLIEGQAEVSVAVKKRRSTKKNILATLRTGETIGLNESGFFSTTGQRTATVIALTEMKLLRLEVKALHDFLVRHHLQDELQADAAQMLRMQLIKQSLPFSKLSPRRLHWLAKHVEEMHVSANETIFYQGEEGDKCYLIRSGNVSIYMTDEEGNEKTIANLTAPALFGEATLITSSPRNATAKAMTNSELLVLSKSYLKELLESETNTANTFMTLMIERSYPVKNPHVSAHLSKTVEGDVITILKDNNTNTYFKLSAEGAFIWNNLDGKHTLEEITLELAEQFNLFAPNLVAGLISKLNRAGFISESSLQTIPNISTKKHERWYQLKHYLVWRKAFGDADHFITFWYQKGIRYLFTPIAQALLCIICIVGFVLFVDYTPNILLFFNYKHASLFLIFALIPLSLLELSLHELGHAFTVKAFGREIHYLGIGWNWVVPTVFTDTSDMWLASPKERILVNVAGIYVDVLIAALATFVIITIENPYLQALLWLYAMYTYIGAFRMLSPLQNMDGYFMLMDWLGKPHLRKAAVRWLVKLPKTFKHPKSFLNHLPEMTYWMACIFYLILISLITLILQAFVFIIFDIDSPSKYFSLLLPFAVVIISSVAMFIEIRREEKHEK